MFLKTLQNSLENTCAGVSAYQFNSKSMSRPDKYRINTEANTEGVRLKKVF